MYQGYGPGLCFSSVSLAGSRRVTLSGQTWGLSSPSRGRSSPPYCLNTEGIESLSEYKLKACMYTAPSKWMKMKHQTILQWQAEAGRTHANNDGSVVCSCDPTWELPLPTDTRKMDCIYILHRRLKSLHTTWHIHPFIHWHMQRLQCKVPTTARRTNESSGIHHLDGTSRTLWLADWRNWESIRWPSD